MITLNPETLDSLSAFFQYGVPGIAAIWLFLCYSIITRTQNKIHEARVLAADKKASYVKTQLFLAGAFIVISTLLFIPSVLYVYMSPASKIAISVRPYHADDTPVFVSNVKADLDDDGRGFVFLKNNALVQFENKTVVRQQSIIQQKNFEISSLKKDLVLEKAKFNSQFGAF
ncbi:hypothetical protein [Planctobacterium marinum]|uniref:hypothetical protein n=1 Tax=Planctobacterium marinum TaxID=1631968 RepID=UPI001E28FFD8|nr:hypothetical protein [Planctobacterium marinum]MCC2604558.1 hypothetical protein [Planctobacterium marinum]